MRAVTYLAPRFVEVIPDDLEEGNIYVAIGLRTMAHRCACGCGREVFTPIGPLRWRLTYNGETLSVHPSLGNWSLPCRSHYWINEGRVNWAASWSEMQVEAARSIDRSLRQQRRSSSDRAMPTSQGPMSLPLVGRFSALWRWLTRR